MVYFTFLFAGVNVLTVTYFLAIERAPFLKEVFPSFLHYVVILLIVGIPLIAAVGFAHFKKIPAFKSDVEVLWESNPYMYKLPPGYWTEAIFPYFKMTSKLLTKVSQNEKLTDKEIKEINDLEKKFDHLLKGGYVGARAKKLPFGRENVK